MDIDDETDAEVRQIMSVNQNGRVEDSSRNRVEAQNSREEGNRLADDLATASDSGHANETADEGYNLDRAEMFARGVAFERNGKPDYALKCYMDCLKDLTDGTSFSKLPHCLHRIADIYYEDKQYEKALQFIQAEKLYYEKALIDLGDLVTESDKHPFMSNGDVQTHTVVPESDSHLVNKADEYERLAHLCLEDQKPHLALEYCGKATKIRQSVFGDSHPVTLRTLELFTSIYAEVGRIQYSGVEAKAYCYIVYTLDQLICISDAMKRYTDGSVEAGAELAEADETVASGIAHSEEGPVSSSNGETRPGVKLSDESERCEVESTGKTGGDTAEETHGESSDASTTAQVSTDEKNEDFALQRHSWNGKMLFIYFIVTLVLALILTMLWCDFGGSEACPSTRFLIQRMRFHWRHYFRG